MSVKNKLFTLAMMAVALPLACAQGAPAGASAHAPSAQPGPVDTVVPAAPLTPRQQARTTLEQLADQDRPAAPQPPAAATPVQVTAPVVYTSSITNHRAREPEPKPVLVAIAGKPGAEVAQIGLGYRLYTVSPGSRIGSSRWAVEYIDTEHREVMLAHAVDKRHIKDVPLWFVSDYSGAGSAANSGMAYPQNGVAVTRNYGAVPTLPPPMTANYR